MGTKRDDLVLGLLNHAAAEVGRSEKRRNQNNVNDGGGSRAFLWYSA